ncbi:cupin domain-containing protein [Streptomyces indiaensis]|uniref:Cupin domain-containing protein n=1 Tax=Streptomyces indiaensis TaxID=284033 RepID=A0ABN3DTJ0_9ACTN
MIVRADGAEAVGRTPVSVHLLADSSATGGAFVPPGRPHAFAAVPGADADLLIVLTPGVERFECFRHLRRVALGEATPERLLGVQEVHDHHFLRNEA